MSRKSSANQRSRTPDSAWPPAPRRHLQAGRLRRSPAQGARLPSTCRFARAVTQVRSLPGRDSSSCGTRLDGAASNRPVRERLSSAALRASAFSSNRPGDVSTKTTSSPGASWSARRMPAGRVTLPRVWTVADRCIGWALRARAGIPAMLDTVVTWGRSRRFHLLSGRSETSCRHGAAQKANARGHCWRRAACGHLALRRGDASSAGVTGSRESAQWCGRFLPRIPPL